MDPDGFWMPSCNWQLGLELLAFKKEEITLPHRAYAFWSGGSSMEAKGCRS